MKHLKLTSGVAMILVSIIIILMSGASSASVAADISTETMAVCESVIGAENATLSMGAYQADDCNTSQLDEESLAAQIAQYNAQIEQYFSLENPCRDQYKVQNEYLLRDVFSEDKTYLVDGGVLDYMVSEITFDETNTVSIINMSLTCYNKWVDVGENGMFEITCCANSVDLSAQMVKEDGVWKLKEHIRYSMTDSWVPEDSMTNNEAYSSQQMEKVQAAELAATEYSDFEQALAAAKEIHVEEICPLTVE